MLILILDHLQTYGYLELIRYLESCQRLQQESGLSLKKVQAADNIDLLSILQEFENYYDIKFGKPPKLTRRFNPSNSEAAMDRLKNKRELAKISQNFEVKKDYQERIYRPAIPPIIPNDQKDNSIEAVGTRTGSGARDVNVAPAAESTQKHKPQETVHETKLLKPLPFHGNAELRDLAAMITRDIFVKNPNVKWSDIAGLEKSKRLIKEAIVFPIKYPQYLSLTRLFKGILKPWKGILLYGPPGTGKTMVNMIN